MVIVDTVRALEELLARATRSAIRGAALVGVLLHLAGNTMPLRSQLDFLV